MLEGGCQELLSKLDEHIKQQQTKKALRTADSILRKTPGDVDVLTCKAALLLDSGSYEDALHFVDSPAAGGRFPFEKAYSLYRTGKLEEALDCLEQVSQLQQAVPRLQLQAQLLYRLGRYGEAADALSRLQKQNQVPPQEVATNLAAAFLADGRAAEVPALLSAMKLASGGSFELAFNRACGQLAEGNLGAAEEQLQLAMRIGRETLFEEELEEDEVEAELAPLAAQAAHVAGRAGRITEAVAAYQDLLGKQVDDAPLQAVCQSNLISLQCSSGSLHQKKWLNAAIRKMEAYLDKDAGAKLQLEPTLEARLSASQKQTLHCNRALLLLHAGRMDACKQVVQQLTERYPGSAQVATLQAAVLARTSNAAEADAALGSLKVEDAELQLQIGLIRAQLAAVSGKPGEATLVLSSLPDKELQHKPALTATLVELQKAAGDVQGAVTTVQQALSFWQGSGSGSKAARLDAQKWLLQQLVHLRLKEGSREGATQAYRQLQALDKSSAASAQMLAQLARASADTDPAGARQMQARLPAHQQPSELDVDALEAAWAGKRAGAGKRAAEGPLEGDADMPKAGAPDKKQRKKRKHKVRLPKGLDLENPGPPPDPDRWLPKWQRSDFTKKKRNRQQRREKEVVRGSQGAGRVDESLDQSNLPAPPAGAPARPQIPSRPAGAKAKKGKGRR